MAWYSSLFQDIYQSSIGRRILAVIQERIEANDFKSALLLDLKIRIFERVATATQKNDEELIGNLNSIKAYLAEIGYPLSVEEITNLNQILSRNGVADDFS